MNQTIDVQAVFDLVRNATETFAADLKPEERLAIKDVSADDVLPGIVYSVDEREQAMSEFDTLAAAQALSTLANQIQYVVDRRMQEAYRMALDVYYAAEELARDPEHAELIPHVEAMRQAHEQQYGKPIPPKQ